MSTFNEREKAFETRFAHDEALRFKAKARRNKLLGLWAAEKLGLSEAEADAYAQSIVLADIDEAADDAVVHKLRSDFAAANANVSEKLIRQTLHELQARADNQIHQGP